MRTILISIGTAGCFLAGCATQNPDRVRYTEEGVRAYHASPQPHANVAGAGTTMRGAYDPRTIPTGNFTGKETTPDQVGQFPTPPRQSEEGARVHDEPEAEPPQVGSGIVPPRAGAGAGTLGETGLQPGEPVTAETIMAAPPDPGSAAPTLSSPLTGAGAAAAGETGQERSTLELPPVATHTPGPGAGAAGAWRTAQDELPARVREHLKTGRPGTITALPPDRLERIEIEGLHGQITLRGEVESEVESLMIANRVRQMEGVESVNNQLRVISPTRPGMQDPGSPGQRRDPLAPEQ